jgi:hypothetical protein
MIDTEVNDALAFKSMEEMVEWRKEHTIPELLLTDGERRVFVQPGFDFRNVEDQKSQTYGQHSATLIFAERRGDNVISCEFFTGWDVHPTPRKDYDGFMGTGFYFHSHLKKNARSPEYAHKSEDCGFTGKRCYGEAGSALYGDKLARVLVNRGSVGIWEEFDQAWKETFNGK